jgi:tetratricopeptide (TPR) repeat protein
VIKIVDGEFKVTEKIDAVVIPETIQDVLMTRIDSLDDTNKTLLKEASVIGSYFFHKILNEVAKTCKDINDRLEYLKGTQFILERERLEETGYLFKHTLARDVTYESILQEKRKELHLKVAEAIESVFSEQLHKFYGMLSLHYSRGENPEKAEEYLIKAGEEALKAAASREALKYYQDALKLYLRESGDAANPGKIAMLEKNIGLAFFNKGHMVEAVEHFDKVLDCWEGKRTENKFIALLKLIVNLLIGIKIFFFPSKKAKRGPGQKENEILDLAEKKFFALSNVDTNRAFKDAIGSVKWLRKFDLTKIGKITIVYSGISIIFSLTGFSFKISGKVLNYAKNSINITKNDIKSLLIYNISKLLHNVYTGNWNEELEYDKDLIDGNLKIGEVNIASYVLCYSGLLKVAQGNFSQANLLVKKLDDIGEDYDNDYTRAAKNALNAYLLLQCRKLNDARDEIDAGIFLADRISFNMMTVFNFGMKAYVQILLKDINGAKNSLSEAKKAKGPASHKKRIMPIYNCSLSLSQFLFDLFRLEEFINSKNKSKITNLRKKASHSGKAAVRNSLKVAFVKTEAFKLMGLYCWLMGKQKKALAWWGKSIRIGEQLGVRLELARVYMEVGKRLLDKKSKFKQLNGIRAEEYLAKAHALFKEINLGDRQVSRAIFSKKINENNKKVKSN